MLSHLHFSLLWLLLYVLLLLLLPRIMLGDVFNSLDGGEKGGIKGMQSVPFYLTSPPIRIRYCYT